MRLNPRTDLYLSYVVNADAYFPDIKYKPMTLQEYNKFKDNFLKECFTLYKNPLPKAPDG